MSTLLEQASLVMIPSGYKEDTVYSVIPETGAGDLSFTRASNGTRVNSAGLVEVMPYNLLQYSEDFSNGAWSKTGVTVTANTTTAPNGTTTADTLVFGASSNEIVQSVGNLVVNETYTLTIYLRVASGTATMYWGNIDYTTPSITVTTEWQRFTVTQQAAATTRYPKLVSSSAMTVFVWGAQLNIGSTAKEYFPTTDRLNVPRLDYSNGSCPALLLEKQSTNYARKNNDLGDWNIISSGSLTKNLNSAISPDGTNNAINLVPNTSNSAKMIYDILTTQSSGGKFTMTCYAKANGYSKFGVRESATAGYYATFNLSTGTVIDNGGNTASIENVGNGWYRCIVSVVYSGNVNMGLLPLNDSYTSGQPISYSYVGDGTKGVLVYGPQLEVSSSYATSLISTTGVASATRVADTCVKTGISSLIGQTEGVLFADFIVNGRANVTNILNSEKNTTASFYFLARTNGNIDVGLYQSGAIKAAIVAGSVSTKQRAKVAYAYKNGDSALYINGVQVGTSADTFTLPSTLDDLFLNDPTTYFSYQESVSFNQVTLFKTRLTNSELAQLTAL